jgi:hypothetical protein
MLALDPGYKANHWFIFIRKERSFCSQKNLLKKMPKVFQAILLIVSGLARLAITFGNIGRRDQGINCH